MKHILAWISLALLLAVPTSAAQDDEEGMFSTFHFQDLKFQFWPSGLDNRADSDGKGSAFTVSVSSVRVEGFDAEELRHCIDGDQDFCSYQVTGGNNDGTVIASEVSSFQTFATVGLRGSVPKVDALMDQLQSNLSVDGMTGHTVRITRVEFQGAEGTVDSQDLVVVNIDAKVTYENDPAASKHLIKVGNLQLQPNFVFTNTMWTLAADGWEFNSGETKPEAAKSLVNSGGYFSGQSQFETLSQQGLEMTVQKEGSKKSPGVEGVVLLAALAALVGMRRRK